MPKDTFQWIAGASFAALRDRMIAADPTTGRLEVRRSPDGGLLFRVVQPNDTAATFAAGGDCPDINESRICPPICP